MVVDPFISLKSVIVCKWILTIRLGCPISNSEPLSIEPPTHLKGKKEWMIWKSMMCETENKLTIRNYDNEVSKIRKTNI